MANDIGPLSLTISLLGIAFVLHFSATGHYFIAPPPTGLGTGPSA
jgi:hypothetical protein